MALPGEITLNFSQSNHDNKVLNKCQNSSNHRRSKQFYSDSNEKYCNDCKRRKIERKQKYFDNKKNILFNKTNIHEESDLFEKIKSSNFQIKRMATIEDSSLPNRNEGGVEEESSFIDNVEAYFEEFMKRFEEKTGLRMFKNEKRKNKTSLVRCYNCTQDKKWHRKKENPKTIHDPYRLKSYDCQSELKIQYIFDFNFIIVNFSHSLSHPLIPPPKIHESNKLTEIDNDVENIAANDIVDENIDQDLIAEMNQMREKENRIRNFSNILSDLTEYCNKWAQLDIEKYSIVPPEQLTLMEKLTSFLKEPFIPLNNDPTMIQKNQPLEGIEYDKWIRILKYYNHNE